MIYDLIILGGGPAGITAGIYSLRKNLNTIIISKDFMGQTGKAVFVENWPGIQKTSGPELMISFKDHLDSLKPKLIDDELAIKVKKEDDNFIVKTDKRNIFKSRSIIIASGRNPRKLKVSGEEKFIGKGISYCPICDAPMFSGKTVAVIGGGNSGFETAIEMIERKSPKVYLLETGPKVIADECLQKDAKKTGKIEVIINAKVKEIKGDKFVQSIIYTDIVSQKEIEVKLEGVFIEIGSVPVANFAKGLVDLNGNLEIKTDHSNCTTKTEGLFAAGDVTDISYKQIIIASGEGAKAALSAYNYIKGWEK
jgi:NADH-dependent peroxiredoxin subunit F